MQTKVTFRHFRGHHPTLHSLALDAADNFEKYNDTILSTNVEFINDSQKTVAFTVHVNGKVLLARDSSDDFKKSLNSAADKMESQLKKHKERISSTRTIH
jgi:putative sigma-54 modulation protein